jgi:DNA-binding MarR family transcriptional regulator
VQVHQSAEQDVRRTIVRALNRDPFDIWTPESLASSLGLSSGLTAKLLAELSGAGMIRRLEGADDEYTAAGGGE